MITAATYNIHKAHSALRGCHLSALKQGLSELNADLVCLQEVQDINTKRHASSINLHGTSQVSALQGEDYPYIAYGANAIYAHGNHGNAILSKYPIHAWKNLDVSDHRLEQRGILHAILDHPRYGDIHVICAHFGLFNVSRIRQAKALIAHVQNDIPSQAPLIIAGDFNDWNLHVHRLIQRELGLTDAIESLTPTTSEHNTETADLPKTFLRRRAHPSARVGRTFPSIAPWLKLDRLYVRGFDVHSAHIMAGRIWRERSDHAPICAKLSASNQTKTTP